MAYRTNDINPLAVRSGIGIGVSIPFSSNRVFTTVYSTREQIKYNIINFLMTGRRERVFQPNFGAGLREQLFEQISPENIILLENNIKDGVEEYFRDIVVANVKVTPQPDENTITIYFSYTIGNTDQLDEIFLNLENG